MLLEGAVLGGITLSAFTITYNRLPEKVKGFIKNHPLITDTVCVVFFYKLMGATIIAHVAVATMSLGMQALLHIARNKEDYQLLFDIRDKAKQQFLVSAEALKSMLKKNKELA